MSPRRGRVRTVCDRTDAATAAKAVERAYAGSPPTLVVGGSGQDVCGVVAQLAFASRLQRGVASEGIIAVRAALTVMAALIAPFGVSQALAHSLKLPGGWTTGADATPVRRHRRSDAHVAARKRHHQRPRCIADREQKCARGGGGRNLFARTCARA